MEVLKKVKVGGTVFAVGETADLVNLGMGGMWGVVTLITVVGMGLYIFLDKDRGVKIRLDHSGDTAPDSEPEIFTTRRR